MNSEDGNWADWISSALCVASRWLSAASLVLVAGALAIVAGRTDAGPFALLAFALVVALGAGQVYFAVRLEFDRVIFLRAAGRSAGLSGFDEALERLGWRRGAHGERTPEARAAGVRALVAWSAWLLGGQLALALAGLWLLQ